MVHKKWYVINKALKSLIVKACLHTVVTNITHEGLLQRQRDIIIQWFRAAFYRAETKTEARGPHVVTTGNTDADLVSPEIIWLILNLRINYG